MKAISYTFNGQEFKVVGCAVYNDKAWESLPANTPYELLLKEFLDPKTFGAKDGRSYDLLEGSINSKDKPNPFIRIVVNGQLERACSSFFTVFLPESQKCE